MQDDVKNVAEGKAYDLLPLDHEGPEELPGGGKHPCIECAKYFINKWALLEHRRGKGHKKRVKLIKEPAYSIKEAESAAGLGSYSLDQKMQE